MKTFLKPFCSIIVALCLILSCSVTCFAHPTAFEHNKELESVLFESGYSKYQSEKIRKYVTALEYASYLTIDQFGGSGEAQYNALKTWGMGGLPLSFSTIDYSKDLQGSGKQINANTHRLYTHQGWDREFETATARRFWTTRRNVLLGTVNSIFGFRNLGGVIGFGEKCNSLAGIIYYVHVLGDYIEADNYKKISILQDLAGHKNTDQNDMITHLKQYVEILFPDQKASSEYKDLIRGLDNLDRNAGKLVNSFGGINTDEEFQEYRKYSIELLELLQKDVPKLLKREDFFKKVFYPGLQAG